MALVRNKFGVRLQWAITVIIALAAGVSIYIFLQDQSTKYQIDSETSNALFVIREIPQGTSLGDVLALGFVESREVLKRSLPPQVIADAASVGDPTLFSQKDISSGQLLLISDFGAAQISTSGLSIPEGSVAISIRLGDVDRLAPFLRPGNEVAVFVSGSRPRGGGTFTKAIISKAQILGIGDARFISGQGYVPAGDTSIITLAVSVQDAGKLIQASKTFSLYLALTAQGPSVSTELVTVEDIVN